MSNLSILFTAVLNMSLTASYVALAVMIFRALLKRAPKIFSYALWSAVFLRLLLPVSFTSPVSFLSLFNQQVSTGLNGLAYISGDIGLMSPPAVKTGIPGLSNAINQVLPQAADAAGVNPMQIAMTVLSVLWITGIAAILAYSIISYLRLKNRIRTATRLCDNVWETDKIDTPFLCGFISPKIYVPVGTSQSELPHVLMHEKTHIRRYDYLIKPLFYLLVIFHWFNPLMWAAFFLMVRDMEMSCDESVIRRMDLSKRGSYSSALLSLCAKRSRLPIGIPLAFGESHVKSRIKNVMNYKKSPFWLILSLIIATAVCVIVLISNPVKDAAMAAESSDTPLSGAASVNPTSEEYISVSRIESNLRSMVIPDSLTCGTILIGCREAAVPCAIKVNYHSSQKILDESNSTTTFVNANCETQQKSADALFEQYSSLECIVFGIEDGMQSYSVKYEKDNQNASATCTVLFSQNSEDVKKQEMIFDLSSGALTLYIFDTPSHLDDVLFVPAPETDDAAAASEESAATTIYLGVK